MASARKEDGSQPSAAAPVAAGPQAEAAVAGEPEYAAAGPSGADRPGLTAGPQAGSAVAQPEGAAAPAAVLDEERRALLALVLDRIVPARADLPGAGGLGVGRMIEATLAAATPLRRLLLEGLTEIELTSARRTGRPFAELDEEGQVGVLQTVERAQPAFFAALVDHTYRGYYLLPAVHAAIGWESRPPQPLGHALPPFDPALLDTQRGRAPFWRRTT